jgi:hypothetical protein
MSGTCEYKFAVKEQEEIEKTRAENQKYRDTSIGLDSNSNDICSVDAPVTANMASKYCSHYCSNSLWISSV